MSPLSHESIGLVENNSYANSDFDQPKNGVILGKDSLGIGQSKGNVIVGNNSAVGGDDGCTLVGSNSTNMSSRGTVIGSNSHAGALLRWKDSDGKLHWGRAEDPSQTVIIGNETSVNNQTQVMALGNKVKVNGSGSVALGHESQVGTWGTALGDSSEANSQGSVALGSASAADREGYVYGYNVATGQAYTFDDFKGKLDQQDIDALKKLDKRRVELEQSLAERKKQYEDAAQKVSGLNKKMATTIFETAEAKDAFMKEREQAQDESKKASDAYHDAPEYDELGKVKTEMRQKADGAGLAIQSNQGAVSVGYDNWTTRQITNVAAGSADTDAVNVGQLKDYATATNAKIEKLDKLTKDNQDNIEVNKQAIVQTNEKVGAIDNRVTAAEGTIDKLDDRSETNKLDIKNLKKNKVNKDDYELDKKNFDEKLDKEIADRKEHSKIFDKRTKDNQNNIEANKQAIAQTNEKVGAIDNRVTSAEGTIVEYGKTLESHTNKLGTISTTVDRHTVEIDELKKLQYSGMQNINNRIDKMDKKLERGLASNAALAGLMQPYNIKKFNVTVGMGGYRGTTAIAAGAGYRFSDSVAVRAGLATDTQDFSDLTYNMSASFEF